MRMDPETREPVGEVGEEVMPGLIYTKGYDPVHHNLFGLDILHQDKRWKTASGEVLELEAMTPSHRANLLRWLRRRSARLAWNDALIGATGPMAARGDMATLAAEEAFDWQVANPGEWLEGLPLVKRLVELVAADEAAPAAEEIPPY